MFGFSLTAWLVAAGIVAAALTGTHWKAYRAGEQRVERAWKAADAASAAAQATADESARLKGHAAALDYEQGRRARAVRTATNTTEVSHALELDAPWAQQSVPRGVRDAIAAALGQAPAPSGPDGAVRVPDPRGADERATGAGLRVGDREPRRLLGPASAPR
jgi:hypothetical protein